VGGGGDHVQIGSELRAARCPGGEVVGRDLKRLALSTSSGAEIQRS
jgi:hypothetical protein